MKVLFIIDTLLGSGAERSLVEISMRFKKFTPVFVSVYRGSMLGSELENQGITVYQLDIAKKYGFSEAVKLLKPIYKQEKPKIVHSTLYKSDMIARKMKSLFPEILLVGSFVNNSYTPLRYQDQSIFMKLKLRLIYEMDKYTARKVDCFISNSKTIAEEEGSALKIPSEKIKVVFRGRDPGKYEKVEMHDLARLREDLNIQNKSILLNVSRLIKRKAQMDLIYALPEILKKFPETVLLLAGHGDQEMILKKEVKNRCLQDNVIFLGRRKDIPVLLASADIFLYPSYAEGLPGALIEAMLAKSLIVASDIGENLECVSQNSALIFEKGNIDDLIDKTLCALRNINSLKTDLGINARKEAIKKFEINAIARQYEQVYEELIAH